MRSGLDRKQVALLLNKKTTDEISIYENGERLPSLGTALRMEAIFQIPIKLLFLELFEKYHAEIEKIKEQHPQLFPAESYFPQSLGHARQEGICFYAALLQGRTPNQMEIKQVDKHVMNLMSMTSNYKPVRPPTLF